MRRLNCFHCLLLVKSPRCASVLGWPFSQNTGSWALTKVFRAEGKVRAAVRRLIWIQIFAITDFIMFSLLWRRQQQIAGLVFSIQVTFADNFYTQFVMLFDAAGFSENPTLCTALSTGFLFPYTLNSGFILFITSKTLRWYPDLDLIDSLSGIFLDFPPCIRRAQNWKFRIQSLFELWHEISLPWRELRCGTGARTLLITYQTSTLSDLIKEKFP